MQVNQVNQTEQTSQDIQTGEVSLNEDIFRPYISLFSGCNVVCLDNRFRVISGGGVLEPGECVLKHVRETIPEPLSVVMEATLYINEQFYCLRLHPIKNASGESEAYIGELMTSEAARSIMERTDGPSDILPLYNAVEMNSAAIWKHAASLRYEMVRTKDYTRLSEVLGIETAMSNLASVCENAFNYAEMMYRSQRESVIDVSELCENLARRCNAALAKCGRRIETLVEPGALYIYADSRRAVVALVNALQNALLYSPQESEPILTVCYREERGRKFVQIRVVNESSMFSSKDFSGNVEVNFSYQRLGYGIPIIKRFAQVSGGWFDMTEENGRVTVTISLPSAHRGTGPELQFRSPGAAQYDTGIPDFTELMMREVVQFFGENPGEIHS